MILSIILYLLLNIANKLGYFCLELIRSMFSLVRVEFGDQIRKYLCGCDYLNLLLSAANALYILV